MDIKRVNDTDFAVVTDTMLADGSMKMDDCCRLSGNVLRSYEQYGHTRIGGLITVTLGPIAYAKVTALAVGETWVSGQCVAKRDQCGECGGSGKLTRLGGDWGKTSESEVACWKCKGAGKL